MNKKRLLLALCLVAFSAAALGYSRSQMQGRAPVQPQRGQPSPPVFRQQDIYEHLFRHYMTVKNRAAEAEREGRDGSELRGRYRREAALNEQEAGLLDEVATAAMNRVAELDARAQQIIAEARARVPGGRLQEGQEPPPPPAELTTLQAEREAVVLQARAVAAWLGGSFIRPFRRVRAAQHRGQYAPRRAVAAPAAPAQSATPARAAVIHIIC